jgi:hypothetical protein
VFIKRGDREPQRVSACLSSIAVVLLILGDDTRGSATIGRFLPAEAGTAATLANCDMRMT